MLRFVRRVGVPAVAALALAASGCFYPADRGRALEAKVDRLQGENDAMRRQLEETKATVDATLPKIDAKIAEVTRALDALDQASRRTDADTSVLVQKTIEDIATLRGQMETQLFELQTLRDQVAKVGEETDRRMMAFLSPEQLRAYEARKKLEGIERPKEPRPFLQLAEDKASAGDTTVARRLYDEFFKKWPNHELSGEAHFGLGEVWFKEEKCREALSEYGKVIQEHPKTKSAPQAFLRSSECFAKLKMNAESKLALEELVKAHPKSPAAKTARTRLAELEKPAPKKKGRR